MKPHPGTKTPIIPKKPFFRTFLESSLPAWLLLAGLMAASAGDLSGVFGLLTLLAILYPGVWSALRLQTPETGWLRRLGSYLVFCLLLGLGIALVMLAARLALSIAGVLDGIQTTDLARLLPFSLAPGIAFCFVRGGVALPGALRHVAWRSCLIRLGQTVLGLGLLAAVAGAVYGWASQPYAGHASWDSPPVLASASLVDFSQGISGWQTADLSVQLQAENGILHISYPGSPALFYTVTWRLPPSALAEANGLQVWANADAATSLQMELAEAGGSRWRGWADLPAGSQELLFFTDFLPSLETPDANHQLDWDQVEQLTLAVYPETGNTDLRLDKIAAVTIAQADWQAAVSEHFWIRYHAADQGVVADVQQSAESHYATLTTALGYQPGGLIPITIASNHAELERQIGRPLQAWVTGSATPDSLAILTPERYSPLFNQRSYETVFELVPHELTHLLLVQKVGYRGFLALPGWLNEGLATYLSGQTQDDSALRQAAAQGNLPALQDLDRAFAGQASVRDNYYAVAGSVTAYLVEAHGVDIIPLLLDSLAQGEDFDPTLVKIAGLDRLALEVQWREHLLAGDER